MRIARRPADRFVSSSGRCTATSASCSNADGRATCLCARLRWRPDGTAPLTTLDGTGYASPG
jgi:hypothetical protein